MSYNFIAPPILKDVFPNYLVGELFTNLDLILTNDEKLSLDFEFFSRYGDRYVSPMLDGLLDSDYDLTPENKTKLINYFNSLYVPRWNKEINALNLTYNILDDYKTTKIITNNLTDSTLTDRTSTDTNDLIEETTINSSDNVNSYDGGTIQSGSNSNVGSNSKTGSVTNTIDDTTTTQKTGSISTTDTKQTKSASKLITDELYLRKFMLYDTIYKEVSNVLTLHIY